MKALGGLGVSRRGALQISALKNRVTNRAQGKRDRETEANELSQNLAQKVRFLEKIPRNVDFGMLIIYF